MLNLARPKPFFYQGSEKAVLLLHGFTGTPQDLKKIGTYLNKQGYSCYCPIYDGHGLGAEAILKSSPQVWWQDAIDGLKFLHDKGFQQIAIIGHSMGGIFTMRLAESCISSDPLREQLADIQLKGIVTMCAPVQRRNPDELNNRLISYGKQYKSLQQKDRQMIDYEVGRLQQQNFDVLLGVSSMSEQAGHGLNDIYLPTFVIQGNLDNDSYKKSAKLIFSGAGTPKKYLKFYEKSGHLIMFDEEKEQLQQDIGRFLNSLNWD